MHTRTRPAQKTHTDKRTKTEKPKNQRTITPRSDQTKHNESRKPAANKLLQRHAQTRHRAARNNKKKHPETEETKTLANIHKDTQSERARWRMAWHSKQKACTTPCILTNSCSTTTAGPVFATTASALNDQLHSISDRNFNTVEHDQGLF